MSDSSPQATIIIGRSSANEQQAPLDAASPPGGINLGRRDSDSHLANNPQDSEGDPSTPAKDSSSPEEVNADTSKEESTSTASKESKDSTGQVRPSSPSPKVSTPTQSKWQYILEKFRRELELWDFLDLVALKAELATRAPKDHFEQFMIQMFLNESPPRISSVEEDGDNFKFLLMPQPYDPLTHPDPDCLMDFYSFRLDRESAVEPNPGQVFAARSAYGQELSRVWNSLDNPPTLRSLPANPETTPIPSRQEKVAVHGEDEEGNSCVFWVPRSQVLSPDPSIPKPLSGDLSVSDLDTSPPILLPSNAVDFDSLSIPKTSQSTTKIRDSPSRCFPKITRDGQEVDLTFDGVPGHTGYDKPMEQVDRMRQTKASDCGKTVCGASLPPQNATTTTNAVLAAMSKASRSLYDDRAKKLQSDRNRPRLKKDMITSTGKVIAFINDFISWAYNDRISQDFKCDPNNPREVALTNEIARLTQLTEAHRACTLRATHHPNYIPLNQRYDEPAHEWDIFRAGAKINPAGISSCVDTDVISTLAMATGGTRPGLQLHQINDEELWENILFASQFPNLATAKLTLSQFKMDWNISNYQSRWIKYISQVGFVVNQSMGMRDTLAIDQKL
ncbi:hypothetical protein P9112_003237 [Eukaryota sp. TZLM1-RC]